MRFIKPRNSFLRNILYSRWIKAWRLVKPKYSSITHYLYYLNLKNINKHRDVSVPTILYLLKKNYYDKIHRDVITKFNIKKSISYKSLKVKQSKPLYSPNSLKNIK